MSALLEPGRGLEVVVGAERHDENVGLVHSAVRDDAPSLRVDRGDRLAEEADAGLGELRVRQPNVLEPDSPEHHVELRVAEDERLGLVDQRDARVLSERLGQLGRQLEAGEARTEDENALAHEPSLCEAEARALRP